MINIAINGFGRIGRMVTRALYESGANSKIKLVAINDLMSNEHRAHLLNFDTVHGVFPEDVALEGDQLSIANDQITLFSQADPRKLPWADLKVDIVLECTGRFNSKDASAVHLEAGAKKVLCSAPVADADKTIVFGVNDDTLTAVDTVVSNASCTTNCLAPVAQALHKALNIVQGNMTTVHAYTADQMLMDGPHSDMYRARAAAHNMVPTKTGAAAAVGLVLPALQGKLDGMAVRVPTANVSLVDLTVLVEKDTSVEVVNEILRLRAEQTPGVVGFNQLPLVSSDFNHNPASSTIDATQTRVNGKLVKVMAWYDNEWGFSNRMLDTAQAMFNAQ